MHARAGYLRGPFPAAGIMGGNIGKRGIPIIGGSGLGPNPAMGGGSGGGSLDAFLISSSSALAV